MRKAPFGAILTIFSIFRRRFGAKRIPRASGSVMS